MEVGELIKYIDTRFSAVADEVRGYRADLNGRLRDLEQFKAVQETKAASRDNQLKRRDIYIPVGLSVALGFASLVLH